MNNCKKLLIASAVATALGAASSTASAAAVTSMTLEDIDGDGAVSGFRFITFTDVSFPTGIPGTFPDDLTFTGDTGNDILFDSGAQAAGFFTTGFNFGGGGDFEPNLNAGGASADVTGGVLDITTLDFGGLYNGTQYLLAPDDFGINNLGDPAYTGFSSTGVGYYLDALVDNGDGSYGIIIRWTAEINQGSSFDGQVARWRLEGTLNTDSTVIPVPAAVWLFGSGLLGLVGVARRKKSA